MKIKILLSVVLISAILPELKAQDKDNKWATNIAIHLNQFDGDAGSEIFDIGSLGVSVGPEAYLNQSFNWFAGLSIDQVDFESNDITFINFNTGLRYKLNNGYILDEDAKFKPYLTAGIGFADLDDTKIEIPYGAGFRVELQKGLDLRVDGTYHKVLDNTFNYFQTTIGLVIYSGKNKKLLDTDGDGIADINDDCPRDAGSIARNGCPEPLDTDNDGVPDSEDNCPELAGLSTLGGCPDGDGDGVIDSEDNCPNILGLVALGGCPDTDGDGVIDSMDECPNIAGLVGTKGCPDSDNDGVIDSKDRCPNEAGIATNKGCPEVDQETKDILKHALTGVQFESGKDVIKRSSYKDLDDVVRIMQSHSGYKLKLSGYTDNTGKAASNLALSDKRAKAVKKYIADKGVDSDRITAKGYGIENPVADNNTAQGRAKNRRVEFKVEF